MADSDFNPHRPFNLADSPLIQDSSGVLIMSGWTDNVGLGQLQVCRSVEDLKLIEAYQFAQSIVAGKQGEAGFDTALAVAEVLAAMSRSWESDQWETVTALEVKS